MSTDANVTDSGPAFPNATQLTQLLLTALPINGDQRLRRRLAALGVSDPAELTPSKLAEFREYVFEAAKQVGIKDPSAWIAHRAQSNPPAAAPAKVAVTASQGRCLERVSVLPGNSLAKAPVASPPRPGPRELFGATKAEVLRRAKAAIDGRKEDIGIIAARLAYAQAAFHASQREIARAVGRSASWVNRLLKWRRSGRKESSPFGPTTRAGRRAQRNSSNNDFGAGGGAEQPMRDEGQISPVGACSLPNQPASPTPSANDQVPSGSTQNHLLPNTEAVRSDASCRGPQTRRENASRHANKQKVPATNAKLSQKLSRQRMLIVLESLRECPILKRAARKAGIHRKTLRYWWKGSEAGNDGYDIEWEGYRWQFHEACEAAIEEAWQNLLDKIRELALGRVTYKIDQHRVDLGYRGVDAYARDANGDFIVEAREPGNVKMQERFLQLVRPERWARPCKQKGGVLVLGDLTRLQREKGYAASTKVRQWKAASRMLRQTNV